MLRSIHSVKIDLTYGHLQPIIDWCERNCSGEWAYWQIDPPGQDKGEYEFYFTEEKDLVAFRIFKT